MSALDLIVSAIVLLGLWRGHRAGALKTVISLCTWVMALIFATKMADEYAPVFDFVSQNPTLQLAVAFLALVLLVVLVFGLVSFLLTKLLKATKLSFFDKLLGAALGILLGTLKVLVLLSFIAPFLFKTTLWQDSPLSQALLPYSPVATKLLKQAGHEVWQEINEP